MSEVRVALPTHLRRLAGSGAEVTVSLDGRPATLDGAISAVEERYPVLRGAIRDQLSGRRRPFVRYFACETDFSNEPPDTPLPDAILGCQEPLLIVGAMAGG